MGNCYSGITNERYQLDHLIRKMLECLEDLAEIEKTIINKTRPKQLNQESFLKCHQRFCYIFDQLSNQTSEFILANNNNKSFRELTTFKLWLSSELVLLKRRDKFQDEQIVEFIYTCLEELENFRQKISNSSSKRQQLNKQHPQYQQHPYYQQQQLPYGKPIKQQIYRDNYSLPVRPPSAMNGNEFRPRTPHSSSSIQNYNYHPNPSMIDNYF